MNHKPGLLAIVTRNTYRDACTEKDFGKVVRLRAGVVVLASLVVGPVPLIEWIVDDGPFRCPHCGTHRLGYLQDDLLVIPPDDKQVTAVDRMRFARERAAQAAKSAVADKPRQVQPRLDLFPKNPDQRLQSYGFMASAFENMEAVAKAIREQLDRELCRQQQRRDSGSL